jgi:hypothetical protein
MDIQNCRICNHKGYVVNPSICIDWDIILTPKDKVLSKELICNECSYRKEYHNEITN